MGSTCCPEDNYVQQDEPRPAIHRRRNNPQNYSFDSSFLDEAEVYSHDSSRSYGYNNLRRPRGHYLGESIRSSSGYSISQIDPHERDNRQIRAPNDIDLLFRTFMQLRGGRNNISQADVIHFVQFLQQFEPEQQSHGLTNEQIQALPHLKAVNSDTTCAVCQDTIKVGEQILLLNCNHSFHTGCLVQWLVRSTRCPTCRGQIDARPAQAEQPQFFNFVRRG